jgi:hypothetical protein
MFNKVVQFIDENHSFRLRNLQSITDKLPNFNNKIKAKIRSSFPNDVIPPDATFCSLFADGCRFRVCKPLGEDWRQRAVFSGDKWFHNLGVQGVFGPDGMFYDWFDGPVGRHNDQYFLNESDVNNILRNMQLNNLFQYWLYTDKGYAVDTHVRSAAHGPLYVSPQQHHNNWIMASERIGVEWGFGKVKARCPFMLKPHLLKLQLSDVAQYARISALLTNAHTCLHQSQTGLYFDCSAPNLEEYFN